MNECFLAGVVNDALVKKTRDYPKTRGFVTYDPEYNAIRVALFHYDKPAMLLDRLIPISSLETAWNTQWFADQEVGKLMDDWGRGLVKHGLTP